MKYYRLKIILLVAALTGYASSLYGELMSPYLGLIKIFGDIYLGNHTDIAINSDGDIFVADGDNHRVLRIDSTTGRVEVFPIKLEYKDSPFTPFGISIGPEDNLYIANPDLHTISVVNPSGNIKKTIGGFGSILDRPVDVVLDSNGDIYVLDSIGPEIHIFDYEGKYQSSIPIATGSSDISVHSLTLDTERNIFVAGSAGILKITPEGKISRFKQTGYKKGEKIYPSGISTGRKDTLFISDYFDSSLYQFDTSGRLLKEYILIREYLKQPSAIVFHNPYVYILNGGNDEVLQFELKYATTPIEHELLGGLYFEREFYQKAIEEFNKSMALGNNSADLPYLIGISYYNLKQYRKAIDYLTTVVSTNPENADAFFHLGKSYQKLNVLKKAIENYTKVLAIKPDHLTAHYNIAEAYLKMKDLISAERHFKEALRLSPDYVDAKIGIGKVLLEKGRLRQAERIFSEVLNKTPHARKAIYFLGLTCFLQNRYEDAIRILLQASEKGPYYIDSLYYLSLSYKAVGNYQKAKEKLMNILTLNPDHKKAKEELQNISRIWRAR